LRIRSGRSAELVSRINRLLGREVVKDIEFRIDPVAIERVRANLEARQHSDVEMRGPIPEQLVSAAGEIADQDLRERFIRAAENCIARREAMIRSES
jgi:hypothetical protein